MRSITEHLSFHAASLGLRSKRNEILASNIANAATPHFKARDINFEEELLKQEKMGPLLTSNSRHYALQSKTTGAETLYRQPVSPSLDGNTVEMAVEGEPAGLIPIHSRGIPIQARWRRSDPHVRRRR